MKDFNDADRAKKKERITRESSLSTLPKNRRTELAEMVRASLVNSYLPCRTAFQIARKAEVPLHTVGDTADDLSVRITDCQLGCFSVNKARHDNLTPESVDRLALEEVDSEVQNGKLTCAGVFDLAHRLKLEPMAVATAANLRRYKIHQCQLGCF